MKKFRLFMKKPVVWIAAIVLVVGVAAAISCALAFGGEGAARLESSRTAQPSSVADVGETEGSARLPEPDNEETTARPEGTDDPADGAAPGEGTSSYTAQYAMPLDHYRYQGMYPDGVPILTEAQVKSITPDMTWRQIYEGFGLQKAFSNGIAFGVEGNRLLLLEWENPDAHCGRTGEELLRGCLDLWREDRGEGRFVTLSDAVGLILYDPDSNRILFGEWSVPVSAGAVTYDTVTGQIQYSPVDSSAPSYAFDADGNPLDASAVLDGAQGYAFFESLTLPAQGNGMLSDARIGRLELVR